MSYPVVYLRDIAPQSPLRSSWDRYKDQKAHWLIESIAEAVGAFLYAYAGLGATAAFVVGNLLRLDGFGSLMTIGIAYCMGIVLAIVVCGPVSGGHFHPGVTISFVVLKGFPKIRALRYIFFQILGVYIACLLVYVQWKDLIVESEQVLIANGLWDSVMFTSSGPAGIFGNYVAPGTNLSRVLLNEFVTDIYIGLVIWACLDPTNHFIPPPAAPWLIGFAYAIAIWGFAPASIAANSCRDVGGRLMALTIWGMQASGGPYAAIAALTNIPATITAALIYETLLCSSTKTLTPCRIDFLTADKRFHEDIGQDTPAGLSNLRIVNSNASNELLEKDAGVRVLDASGVRV